GVVARPLRYPEYEGFLLRLRARKGVETCARGSVKEIARLLRDNRIIGIMPDQDIDSLEGTFVDFFGRPTYTPIGPAALALMTGAPILPCFIVRTGRRFRIVIEETIPMTRTDDRTQDLLQITQAWSRVVESYLRCYPDQWVWMHRRWKTTPPASVESHQPSAISNQQHNTSVRKLQPALLSSLLVAGSVWCGAGRVWAKTGMAVTPEDKMQIRSSATDQGDLSSEEEVVTQETASQRMDSFSVDGYAPNGTKRWELHGRGANGEGSSVTIFQPNAVSYDVADPSASPKGAKKPERDLPSTGRTAYLTASLAQVQQASRRVRLEHDVTIHTSDGLWLTSPVLYWLPDQNQMVSDLPVRLETDQGMVRGRGATAHTQLKQAVLLHDIEMVLNPTNRQLPGESPAGENGGRRHVTITCDGPLTFDYEHRIATFERNVHVTDAQGDLYSETLVAYLDAASRTINYAEALGDVRIVQHGHTATSERAVYEPAKAKVTLLGDPSLLVLPNGEQAAGGSATTLSANAPVRSSGTDQRDGEADLPDGPQAIKSPLVVQSPHALSGSP
ncbi:MAG: LPS export ABC transporter periplasmic protein LptC, partial [Candidatus Omnitrophica bacterium]|nr:LPS export ABC transporter periplasmic protein LptC [Candidatus Omnitrophota bacterium]